MTLAAAAGADPWWKATLVQTFGFIILLGILIKLVVPAVRGILTGRTKGVEDTFAKLEKEKADASRELAELRKKLAEIDLESKARHAAALADADKTRERSLADAAATAQVTLEKARREIQIERDKAVLDLRQDVERLTLEAADHLTKTAMNDSIQGKLVDGYLGNLEGAARS
ncbi:MAG TPA: ATP synthase F0 subunit B [Planctomycetota bacterium]